MKRKLFIALAILHLFVGLGALPAGYSMVTTTDGSGLGMSPEMLTGSPFSSFLIPGLFLLFILGLLNLLVAMPIFRQHKYSGIIGMTMGAILFLWILIQVGMIGLSFWLQPLFLVVGLIQMTLGYWIFRLLKV